MKTKSIMLIAVSLGFGLIAAIGMSQVLGKNTGDEQAEVEMVQIFVAKEAIEIGDELTDDNLNVQKQPANFVPESAVRSMEEFQNMVAIQRIPKNAMIFAEYIVDKNDAKLHGGPPKGFRAYTFKSELQDSHHNSIQAGDKVDFVGVFRVRNEFDQEIRVPSTFLKSIEVWKVNDNGKRNKTDEENDKVATISVLLTPKQCEVFALAEEVATKVRCVLSNRDDDGKELEEFNLEKLMSMFKKPETEPKPPADPPEKNDTEAVTKTESKEDPNSEYKYQMTIYRGGKAVKYGFKDRTSLPKVIETSSGEEDEKTEPETNPEAGSSEKTVTVEDDFSDQEKNNVSNGRNDELSEE